MTFAAFIPFMIITLIANLTERNRQNRWVTTALLVATNLLVLLLALLVAVVQFAANLDGMEMPEGLPLGTDWGLTALALGLTGLVGFLPLVPSVRRLLGRWLKIEPESTVHTTALVFAIYLVGLTLAQLPLVGGLEGLEQLDLAIGPSELWQQALALLLLGVIGVGLGLRRDWAETRERLGLRWPAWTAWLGVIGLVILLEGVDFGVATAWNALAPASYERIGRISQSLFGGFMSPLGALAVGLSAGIGEETLFRGALQPRFGVLLTSALFAISHIQYGFTPATAVVFAIGLVLAWVRKRWGLAACIALHALYNIANVLLASFWP